MNPRLRKPRRKRDGLQARQVRSNIFTKNEKKKTTRKPWQENSGRDSAALHRRGKQRHVLVEKEKPNAGSPEQYWYFVLLLIFFFLFLFCNNGIYQRTGGKVQLCQEKEMLEKGSTML